MSHAEVKNIVATTMKVEAISIVPGTMLSGLHDIATQVCMATGREIILNEGDTWQDLLNQIL